ncbi:MAG: hypothetical protein EF807_07500 [Candidatus Methanolliviera hydrocarbonicum]|uniref:Uncharacterized protein n=1 Tax=Candidatus Methanolliviera hydrocarbonicum TaxID=2491085 RepID=A0A520KV11_9EURY|nr:MAG: hypothetical protein EF807_07500 [Candidatus Methanolliviera hydrocarbonicum]
MGSVLDLQRVGTISPSSSMIANIDTNTPYSLLVFHPAFYRSDMTITPGNQVEECYKTAKRCLNKVNIRNKHLLG